MAGGHTHPYHILEPSPWPLYGSVAAGLLVVGGLFWMRDVSGGMFLTLAGLAAVVFVMFGWWNEVFKEGNQGDHTDEVSGGLRLGMALFITSEVMFFSAFFWAFFWGALMPTEAINFQWPPESIQVISAWGIPLVNTLLLLLSGTTLTWAHHKVVEGKQEEAYKAFVLTVVLGVIFLGFQIYEYTHLEYKLWDTIYGSVFYMATGFHGFHVFVGAVFLIVCMVRAGKNLIRSDKHVHVEAAAWYWHFVDVVWLFLFVCVYVWGNWGAVH